MTRSAIFSALTVSPARPLWPGFPSQITRNQTAPRTDGRIRSSVGSMTMQPSACSPRRAQRQGAVAADLLLDDQVRQQVPSQPESQSVQGRPGGEQGRHLPLGVAGAAAADGPPGDDRFKRPLLPLRRRERRRGGC